MGGKSLVEHAIACAEAAGCKPLVSTDVVHTHGRSARDWDGGTVIPAPVLARPAELAQDDTPMVDVVRHALDEMLGEPDDLIVLLQPTQPFRKPEHVQQAIALLRESRADSVVSVVPLPLTHSPEMQCVLYDGQLYPYDGASAGGSWWKRPTRRQQARQTYIPDGTCYAFKRDTVDMYGNLFGADVRPLIIDPADSCELDSESDWAEVERRWKERHGG